MNNITKEVNQILSEWDPLDVGENISLDEYQAYIPQIIRHIKNKEDLIICVENILINGLEVGYDIKNKAHKKTINDVVERIMQLHLY